MGKVRIEQGCRDCKKWTNSGVANLGRNTGRALAAVYTAGVSEIGLRAFAKKCRTCGHQLSLHQGAEARTPQPAVSIAQPTPPPPVGPPAGWYPDPPGAAPLRWWNGQEWTEYTTNAPQ